MHRTQPRSGCASHLYRLTCADNQVDRIGGGSTIDLAIGLMVCSRRRRVTMLLDMQFNRLWKEPSVVEQTLQAARHHARKSKIIASLAYSPGAVSELAPFSV
jgi:hypothetical protein